MTIALLLATIGIDQAPRPKQAPGVVCVTKAIEVYSPPVKPGPVKQAVTAAANVATAPVKVLQRVCDGGVCRMVEVDAVPNYSESPNSCQACQGGNCYRPQRRGWFGRRR